MLLWCNHTHHLYRLGSPSTSLEAVGTTGGQPGVVTCMPKQWEGSDEEGGEVETIWSTHVSADIMHTLTDSEKRRQEIINGNNLHFPTK